MNEKQKTSALLWVKQVCKSNIIVAAVPIVLNFGLYVIYLIACIVDGHSVIVDRNTLIMSLMVLIIGIFCFSLILKEIRKIKAIKSDKALITEVEIVSREARQSRRGGWYFYVKVKGLYEDSKPVERDISISKNLYSAIRPNEKGYVIRFDSSENSSLPKTLGFIPK